jgi:2-keto-4-pentenoate hydratase
MSIIDDTASAILNVYASGLPIDPVRDRIVGIDDAYAVQRKTIEAWVAQGRKITGHKIGLTSKAVQAQLGVDQPDFGILFGDMVVPNASEVGRARVLQPRVEAEIAFVLKHDLKGGSVSAEDVIAATEYVCPALEICGSRIVDWNIKIEDTIADNASSGLIVLGSQHTKPSLAELPAIAMMFRQNGNVIGEGRGAACLDNPANAVAWLATTLTRFGSGLKAGDVVMSGALSRMTPAAAGDEFAADFGSFGSVSVRFAR